MRRKDWLDRLQAYLRANKKNPYKLGSNDCCLFCAGAIQAMTDEDLTQGLAGTYSTDDQMQALIAKHGGSLSALVTEFSGVQPTGRLCARRGDVVLVNMQGREFVGICVGNDVAYIADDGINYCSMKYATQSWKIG